MINNWTKKQKDIYDGLKCIGDESAQFFLSAMENYYDENKPARSYNLAHCAREIDGGLRDILSSTSIKKQKESQLKNLGQKILFGADYKENKGLIASVLTSLQEEDNNGLKEEWISVSKEFHTYAHRHGSWKKSRGFSEIKILWERYENVLRILVGSYYSLVSRIDHIINNKILDDNSVGCITNLLSIDHYSRYIFSRLSDYEWLDHLNRDGFFNPSQIQYNENGYAKYWIAIEYLVKLLKITNCPTDIQRTLVNIIRNIVAYDVRPINNYHIWWNILKIIDGVNNDILIEISIAEFQNWLNRFTDRNISEDICIHDLLEILLPKFLGLKEGQQAIIPFAEAILDAVIKIRSKKVINEYVLNEAELVWDGYVLLKSIREKYKDDICRLCSNIVIETITNKLQIVLEYRQKEHHFNYPQEKPQYQMILQRIPTPGIEKPNIGYSRDQVTFVVKEFTKAQRADLQMTEDYLYRHRIEPEQTVYGPVVLGLQDEEQLVTDIHAHIAQASIMIDRDFNIKKKVNQLVYGLHDDVSSIWFKSVSDTRTVHLMGADDVLAVIFRDLLFSRCQHNVPEGTKLLESLLDNKYRFPIFQRFAIYVINKQWDNYNQLFDPFIMRQKESASLGDWEVELQDLLSERSKSIDDKTILHIKKLITETVPEYYASRGERDIAYWGYKWLSPMREHPLCKDDYSKFKKQAEIPDDQAYEPNRDPLVIEWIGNQAPITVDELMRMLGNGELPEYLRTFVGPERYSSEYGRKPDKWGLGDTLRDAVKNYPDRFIQHLSALESVPYIYISRLIRGYRDAWKSRMNYDYKSVLEVGLKYLQTNNFIHKAINDQGDDAGNGKYIWLIDDLVELIEDGSRNDAWAFDKGAFAVIDRIFEALIPYLKEDPNEDFGSDPLHYAINTTVGKTIESFIIYSLRRARATKQKVEHWGKAQYERYKTKGIEYYIWLGRYLPNIKYLDPDFTEEQIKLFAKCDVIDKKWQIFINGYLIGNKIYDDVYESMRDNIHKAIPYDLFPDIIEERLVQYIVIGYMRGLDTLQEKNNDNHDSLLWQLIHGSPSNKVSGRMIELATYLWQLCGKGQTKDESTVEYQEYITNVHTKTRAFWSWTYNNRNILEGMLADQYTAFLGKIADLIICLPEITAEYANWLMLSVPHIGQFDLHVFINYLANIKDKDHTSLMLMGKIFVQLLENKTPTHNEDEIHEFIRKLYAVGDETKHDVDNICNTFGRRGRHFLRELYENYNPKTI